MDIITYYTDVSKKEVMNDKEIKTFSDDLNSELERVSKFRFNSSIVEKVLHPFVTIRTISDFRRLSTIKRDFDSYVNSDVLMYDNGDFGELALDLESAAKYYKPKIIKEYVKSQRVNVRNRNNC